ncbi:MAG: hypothetical protein ACRDJN_26530 [Chloroflexota bacterium]
MKIDATAPGPTTQTLAGGTLGPTGWYAASPNITLASSDANSGVAAIYYQFVRHGVPAPTNTLPGGWTLSSAPFVAPDGNQDLYAFATDVAGNAETPVHLGQIKVGRVVTFDDATGQDRQFGGEYPAGLINWGTNRWWLASPQGAFTTKSISFNGNKRPVITSNTLSFVTARRLFAVTAYNVGTATTTVTLRCAGQPDVQQALAPAQVAVIDTGWTAPCAEVLFASTNGWDTNFDNLLLDSAAP